MIRSLLGLVFLLGLFAVSTKESPKPTPKEEFRKSIDKVKSEAKEVRKRWDKFCREIHSGK